MAAASGSILRELAGERYNSHSLVHACHRVWAVSGPATGFTTLLFRLPHKPTKKIDGCPMLIWQPRRQKAPHGAGHHTFLQVIFSELECLKSKPRISWVGSGFKNP